MVMAVAVAVAMVAVCFWSWPWSWPWPPHGLCGCDRDLGHGLRFAGVVLVAVVSVAVVEDIASVAVAMSVLDCMASVVSMVVMQVGGGRG